MMPADESLPTTCPRCGGELLIHADGAQRACPTCRIVLVPSPKLQQQITAEVYDETRYTPEAREIIEQEAARRPRPSVSYQSRPRWTEAVRMFISDEVLDEKYGYPQEGGDDWLHSLVEDAVNNIFCNAFGHDIVDDQCMIPEHRYCVYCGRREGQITSV